MKVNKKPRSTPPVTIQAELLRPKDACVLLGMGRTCLHNFDANDPTFPRKIILSKRLVGYRRQELLDWLTARSKAV